MKEASYYKKLKNNIVQCRLCPWYCLLKDKERGKCNVRENQKGKLYSLIYNKPIAMHIDSTFKKPLFHFLPGTNTFSIGAVGCNLFCKHCQNIEISHAKPEEYKFKEIDSKEIISLAKKNKCPSISYTYTEPIVNYEFIYETSKLAKKNNIKNIMVTNGYINKEPLQELYKYINAVNVDLKGFTEEFYKKNCGVKLGPVLDALKEIYNLNIWLEITNLIIPGLNDNFKDIENMCKWIKENLNENVPLHFSRFFPYYQLSNLNPTPKETLEKAKKIAEKYLNYVYIGNIYTDKAENTFCPKCKSLLISRIGFQLNENKIKRGGKCVCGEKIPGVWQ